MANEQEIAQVLAMAKQYPEVSAEIVSIEQGLEHYAHVHAVNPPIKLKEKIFTEINGAHRKNISQAAPAKVVSSSFWKYVAAASIILLIGSTIFNVNYYRKYETA